MPISMHKPFLRTTIFTSLDPILPTLHMVRILTPSISPTQMPLYYGLNMKCHPWCSGCGVILADVETLGDQSLTGEGRALGIFSIGCMCIFSWNSFSPSLPLLPVHAKLMILPPTSSPTMIFCTERVPESQSH